MKFNVLGSVGIEVEGHFRSIRGGHQRVLLAVLLVNGGQLVPAEDLYGELWGEQPPVTVENALQAHVSRLRRTLQECGDHAPALITRSTGYSLEFPAQDLDMNAFRQGVGRARSLMAKDRDAAAALLTQSLGLWRGAPLQDVAGGLLCQSVAVQLAEEHLAATEDKLWLDLEREIPSALGELKRMSIVHPWRERVTEMLMLALYRCGRQAEAIEAYHTARGRMAAELGIEPSPQLKERFLEVLNQSPACAGKGPGRGVRPAPELV
ncbi:MULTISPECIES: AfsR/SARP family transcriptional regulator [Actinomycetes]|uniref:AfsR/SARP family transcriptional regulator n=1 Tax=Actinomycetes TaxID=1760 RepID=UPI0003C2EC16|nr:MULTISPECIES: AfsR/SARP family transcriptional regulator [Streptomyces]ESP95805.1 SARP family transcriptional regulator [Streptomyces sp. GBA 94-10 4N24]ESQ01696.1 SARP family transcriptional regulator [Streptomyces sp. GBA 94-10 4N24]ESQ01861.1 SARP family transcriptional regulator [Streptomyces sp. PVA_94-07]ESQ07702.1 SARP family transcriptional regulator [Streptomyces sp. PVA_94-07]RWZ75743.1 SARP family transcriptional regulator [Streptomyces albidoflavus]